MAFDPAALLADVLNGPLASGCEPLAAAGDDAGLAALYNAPGAGVLPRETMPKGDFLLAVAAPAALLLAARDDATQRKWDRVLALLGGSPDTIRVSSPAVRGLLAAAVGDSLLASGDAAALGSRPCSRAESLFGGGSALTADQVSEALRPLRPDGRLAP